MLGGGGWLCQNMFLHLKKMQGGGGYAKIFYRREKMLGGEG